jgi:hypothetical protein
MLPTAIQASVANGQTPVAAALELIKLPSDQQVAVFDSLAQGGEKITAARVRQKRQETHESTGEGGPVPRNLKQFKAFLEGRTGSADPGHKLASQLHGLILRNGAGRTPLRNPGQPISLKAIL